MRHLQDVPSAEKKTLRRVVCRALKMGLMGLIRPMGQMGDAKENNILVSFDIFAILVLFQELAGIENDTLQNIGKKIVVQLLKADLCEEIFAGGIFGQNTSVESVQTE